MTPIPMCLVFVVDGAEGQDPRRVLLGLKHQGIGKTNVVGLGGHIEAGESAAEAAVRETHEEAGVLLDPERLTHAGLVRFRFPSKPHWDQDVEVFLATAGRSEVTPSDEISPAWYEVGALPLELMWDDARYWLPQVLDGKRIDATITFASDNRTVRHTAPRLTPAAVDVRS